jgi:hypothetical protein
MALGLLVIDSGGGFFNLQPSPPRKGAEKGPGWEVQGGETTIAGGGRHGEEGEAPCSAKTEKGREWCVGERRGLSHPFPKGRAGCIAYVCQDLFPHIC